MPTIVTRLGKGSPLTTAELDANLTNINAETVDNSGVFNLRPSLDIDLVGSKTVSPLVSFSRGSTGTYFDSDGLLKTAGVNQPRFDYDPVTGELKGLLVEESRTNLLTYSEQFDIMWNKNALNAFGSGSVVNTTATLDPSGRNASDFLQENFSNTFHYLAYQNVSGLSKNTYYNFSVYVKANQRNWVYLDALDGPACYFNLESGVTGVTVSGGTGSIQKCGNGWFRCTLTFTTPASLSGTNCRIFLSPNGSTVSYEGNGTSGIYIWGAQLEAGSTPTSYIPTTSAAVTRSADQLSINKTSNWFNSTNGTLSLSHDAASGQPLLGDGSSTIVSSLGAGTVNIDYSNTQLSVVTQSGQSNNTIGIFNFDTDLYIGGNSTSKINNHIKYLKFYPNNLINSTPDGSGFILDDGYALLQEDGSVLLQE